ncbi:hypothetical protein LP418_10675 [Nocardioides sp. B-3]|nr:hypothetical protein LP418_10675 [Nocardioides sp. B-3]
MNKPIRTISMFCLLLFAALLLNSTYLMYFRADELAADAQNRRVITAAFARRARRDRGRQGDGGAQHRVRRPVQVPAHLLPAVQVRPDHRLLLLLLPDRHRALAERRALRRRLAAVRDPLGRHAQQHRAAGRQRRADHQPGRAGRRVGGAAEPAR